MTSTPVDKLSTPTKAWQFWRPPWSLRTALVLFAIGVVAPTLAVFAFQYRTAVLEKQDEMERQLSQLSHSVAADINREVAIKRAQVLALSTSRALRNQDLAAFRAQADVTLQHTPGWMVVMQPDGAELMDTRYPSDTPLPHSPIAEAAARVAATGVPEESDLYWDNGPNIATLRRVEGADLVLAGALPADHLDKVLATSLPKGWLSALIDRTGTLIARSRGAESLVGKPVRSDYWHRASAAPEGTMQVPTLDGVDSYTHWHRQDNGWTVSVAVPVALLRQPMLDWERQFFLTLIMFAVLSGLGTMLGAHLIARSMTQLTARARSIGAGTIVDPIDTTLREVNEFGDVLATASRDRQRVEYALRESDRRFRAIFDQDTAGMSVVQRDGRFLSANRRLCEITGYSETELRATTIFDITHPDDVPNNRTFFAEVFDSSKSYTLEKRLIRKDGQPVWVQVSCVAVCDDAGQAQYVLGLILDIDDRNRAAMANAHLAAVVTSSGDAIMSVSPDGNILTWNEAAERLYGYTAIEAIGQPVTLIVPEDRKAEIVETIDAARKGGIFRLETVRRRKSGRLTEVAVDVAPIREPDGKVIGISAIAHDITERKRIEGALREGEARLARMIDSAIDAIISVDSDQRIILFNPAAERMFGTPAADAVGSPLTRYIPERLDGEAIADGEATKPIGLQTSMTGRRAGGEEFPIEASISPIEVSGDHILTVILRDISERVRVETALQQSEQQFRTLTNSIPQLAWMTKADGWVVWYNNRWYEYTGTTPEQMEGWGWQSVYEPGAVQPVLDRWKQSLDTGEPFDMTISLKGADGRFRPFLTRALPLHDAHGRIACWFGTNTDITAQMDHEAHLNFVMRELSHRSKNLLAVVQAMARQTMRHSNGFEDFEIRFTGRLLGLARSHDLLVRADWTGASIRDLVTAQLASFVPEEGNNLEVNGPDLTLNPEAVQNLGFALFELATNAVKYGALSVPTGKVVVSWNLVEGGDGLRFVWREIGGPAVTQPVRKGFGTVVIERFMSTAFDGDVSSVFEQEGFCWTLFIPGKHLMKSRTTHEWPWRKEPRVSAKSEA